MPSSAASSSPPCTQGGESIPHALRAATRRLAAVSDTPRLDAELLMAHALGVSREEMLLGRMESEAPAGFDGLVARRENQEPVAYITGRRGFWTIELEVGLGVLVPRPDSETLIEAALDHFAGRAPATILDLGTGPGTLLLAALDQWPAARGLGIDRSETALGYARRNARRLGLAPRSEFRLGDWGEGVEGRYQLILCNPPYVGEGAALAPDVERWEPSEALFAGADGLAAYRALAPQVRRLLAPGGAACFEIGLGQAKEAAALFAKEGFAVSLRGDLGGVPRCLVARIDPE